jgi:hypothetical protein
LGIVSAFGAAGGPALDPAQKTRIVAQGIAEAVGYLFAAIFLAPLPALAVGVLGRRRKQLEPAG